VKTRGGRRLVCGGAKKAPDTCYYSDDHYRSFRKIRT
jgi:ribonuclease T1